MGLAKYIASGRSATQRDLDWAPTVSMADALKGIFDCYRGQVSDAREMVN
jgi:hypothetical protein